jgi:hypothetical protein
MKKTKFLEMDVAVLPPGMLSASLHGKHQSKYPLKEQLIKVKQTQITLQHRVKDTRTGRE